MVNLSETVAGHNITLSKPVLKQKYTHSPPKKDLRAVRGIRNTVTLQRKIEKFDTAMLKIAKPLKKFPMFRNTTISEFKTTITQVPHENLPNTIIPETFSM